jgi:hypothetical protein
MEKRNWPIGSLGSSGSMCSLEGERVWSGGGSKNGGGVCGIGCIDKVGTTIGVGGKAKGTCWSGIREGHSQGTSYTWFWDGGEDLENSTYGVGNKTSSWKITFLLLENWCEVWSYKR